MIISKSLPIKFYLNGVETFNEGKRPGTQKKNFYQKFNSTDNVVLQIQDDSEQTYSLAIKDEDGVEVDEIAATKEEINDVWFYSWNFTFTGRGLDPGCYSLEIYKTTVDGSIVSSIPALLFAGEGTTTELFVEIEGTIDSSIPVPEFAGEGSNYEYSSESFRMNADAPEDLTICAAPPIDLYFSGAFGPGTIVYTEKEFTNFPAGYNYIMRISTGIIYAYNDATGEVGAETGFDCNP